MLTTARKYPPPAGLKPSIILSYPFILLDDVLS